MRLNRLDRMACAAEILAGGLAVSTAGIPVSYTVKAGPATVEGNTLTLTSIPPRSRFPVKVTVVAWQYGRSLPPRLQTAAPVDRSFWITRPLEEP